MVAQAPVYTFGFYCSQILNFIFQNPFIQANPLSLIFLVSLIPSIFFPIPKVEFIIPIITNGGDASGVIIASTAGSVASEVILYFLAKRGSAFLLRREQKRDIEIKRFIHKYSFLLFIASPFIPIGTDILVLYAGIRNVKLHHFLLPMTIGFALKNIIVVWLVLAGLYFLPIVSKICSQ